FCTRTPPRAPAVPPIPTTLATAARGNMSDAVVNRLADQPWCAAVARLTSATTTHMLFSDGAKITGTTARAHASMVVLRAAFTVQPRWIRLDENHPPAILPTLEAVYTTMVGIRMSSRPSPKLSWRYLGNQKR